MHKSGSCALCTCASPLSQVCTYHYDVKAVTEVKGADQYLEVDVGEAVRGVTEYKMYLVQVKGGLDRL